MRLDYLLYLNNDNYYSFLDYDTPPQILRKDNPMSSEGVLNAPTKSTRITREPAPAKFMRIKHEPAQQAVIPAA